MTLGDRIERLLASGFSLEGLADRVGVSLSTVYRWRSRKKTRVQRAALRALEALEAAIVKRDGSARRAAR